MNDPVFTAWARLLRAQTHLLGAVERELKQAGLPPLGWYDVLLELSRPGVEGLRPVELEKLLLLAQYNLSRLLDRLEKAGLVERQAVADDARGQRIVITAGGRDMRERMWPAYRDAVRHHFAAKLSDREIEVLAQTLGKITA
jgi:DNA-binding MarR family transcriptional regulator